MTWKITGAPGTGEDLLYSQAGTPTLDLRFASSKSLNDNVSGQNLIDFTRGGNGVGTYVGSDGLIKNSVVNLLLRSEEFENASWTAANIQPFNSGSIANAIQSPDGAINADKIVETTATGDHEVKQVITTTASTSYTLSCFAKKGERDYVTLSITQAGVANYYTYFDLTNGAIGTSAAGNTATITPYPNGWYRCAVTRSTAVGQTSVTAKINIATSSATSYTGDGTSGIYLWGAQLEQSSTVGEYVKTTSSISGAPRFDHDPETGESLGLLIEESRANLLLNSATLATQNVTVTAVAHTLSFYGTGTVTLSGTHSATVVGTGAYPARTTLTFTPTAGTLTVTVSGTVQYANLEIGSFATSWIPTSGTTVTRNADMASITGANFSRWYSQSEGTVFADFAGRNTGRVFMFDNSTDNERWEGRFNAGVYAFNSWSSGIADVNIFGATSIADLSRVIGVHAHQTNNATTASNGIAGSTDTTCTIPSNQSRLFIGSFRGTGTFINGPIRRLAYFDRRLPNATLQAITT